MSEVNKILKNKFDIIREDKPIKQDDRLREKLAIEESLSEDDIKKLDAFSGLIKSFGVEIEPEIVEEDLQLQIKDIKPVIVEEPKIDENKKIEALETLFSGLTALKPKPLVMETKTPEPVKPVPVVISQTPVDIREAVKLLRIKLYPQNKKQ